MIKQPPTVNAEARTLVQEAFSLIYKRSESGGPPERILPFRNTERAYGVVTRAQMIARAMELPERQVTLVEIAAAFSGIFQNHGLREGVFGIPIRRRFGGLNETSSAAEAVQRMHATNYSFTRVEMGLVASAIVATIAEWYEGEDCRTAIQPLLTTDSHPVIRAVALADLGAAGMDAETFSAESFKCFAETNIGIMNTIRPLQVTSDLPANQQDSYRMRMVYWLETQVEFAEGRKTLLRDELWGFRLNSQVLALFDQFDRSIELAKQNLQFARDCSFRDLMCKLSPNAFPFGD